MTLSIAPDLPDSLEWLNADAPVALSGRGWLTALAFFNVGSIWSLQELHELQVLCARHPQRLRAVGVHVPRFEHERDPGRVLNRLRRHGITLPVAHDVDWVAWQQHGVETWPSIVLVDGEGRVQARVQGRGALVAIEASACAFESELLPDFDEDATPMAEAEAEPGQSLCFPVGLAVTGQHLYVADSGHHRILECSHEGRILREFGSGAPGFIDGPANEATFCRPHGLCLLQGVLYVADTGNHAVRRIDLRSGEVDTLCGSGAPGSPTPGDVADPRAQSLDWPHALAAVRDQLHIATAGDNRIWSYDLGRAHLAGVAGSGELDVRDGRGMEAAFAQPLALAAVEQALYVCDSVGSAIRKLQLRGPSVQTLVGQGPWQFGDANGARASAQLQEPQAIALDPDAPLLWIADTGNDRLRRLRLGGGEVASVALSQPLHGPAGLAVGEGSVWIADTDAHAVLRMDPHSGELHSLEIGE